MAYDEYTDDELMQMAGEQPGGYSEYSDDELMEMAGSKPAEPSKRGLSAAWEEVTTPVQSEGGIIDTLPRIGEKVLRTAGHLGEAAGEAMVAGVKGIYNLTTTEETRKRQAETMGMLADTDFVKSQLKTFKGLGEAWKAAKQEYPRATEDIEAGVSALNLIPAYQVGKAIPSVAGTVAKSIASPTSAIIKESFGALTGRGAGFVEEMLKGSEAAEKAMRGGLTGEEVVGHAKQALQKIRDTRSVEYLDKLDMVRANTDELTAVRTSAEKKIGKLAGPDDFDLGITLGEDGRPIIDFSKSTIIEHQKVVERAIEDVMTWQDNTPRGLDTLTKRLSKYEDQAGRGTPAEAFVTQLRNDLSKGLKKTVPEYEEMTKGYREATNLIKDIESNLMLRKEGMSGRITADQTLRRLSSAFREKFEMRKDLLSALGNESGVDVPAELAGYLAQQWLPAGSMAKVSAGGIAYLGYLNPQVWPLLAASSPRVVGEFLNAFGKARNMVKGKMPRGTSATPIYVPESFPTKATEGTMVRERPFYRRFLEEEKHRR